MKKSVRFVSILIIVVFCYADSNIAKAQDPEWEKLDFFPNPSAWLTGVWGSSGDNVYVIGATTMDGFTSAPVLYRFDGEEWSKELELTRDRDGSRMVDIWGSGSEDIYVTSQRGLWHYDGSSWQEIDRLLIDVNNSAVFGTSADDVYLAGIQEDTFSEHYYHYNGSTWEAVYFPEDHLIDEVTDIWGSALDDIYMVSHSGFMTYFDGSEWASWWKGKPGSPLNALDLWNVWAVWGSAKSNVFLAGSGGGTEESGVVAHFDGVNWQDETLLDHGVIGGIGGAGSKRVYAVGADDLGTPHISYFNGTDWQDMNVPSGSKALHAVWANPDGQYVFAVGNEGTVLRLQWGRYLVFDSLEPDAEDGVVQDQRLFTPFQMRARVFNEENVDHSFDGLLEGFDVVDDATNDDLLGDIIDLPDIEQGETVFTVRIKKAGTKAIACGVAKASEGALSAPGCSNAFAVQSWFTLTLSTSKETVDYGETIELTVEAHDDEGNPVNSVRDDAGLLLNELNWGFFFKELNADLGTFPDGDYVILADPDSKATLRYQVPSQEKAGTLSEVRIKVYPQFNEDEVYDILTISLLDGGGSSGEATTEWVSQAYGAGEDVAHTVAVDDGAGKQGAAGNVYVAGYYEEDLTFGSFTLPRFDEDDLDIFLAAVDEDGSVLWAERAGGGKDDAAYDIVVDGAGPLYVTGSIGGEATFGSTTLSNGQGEDVFLAKYDADGRLLWATESSSTRFACCDQGAALALDNAGNVLLTGDFMEDITFDTITLTGVQNQDLFVAKYDPEGNVVWARKATGSGHVHGTGIGADSNSNVYIGGYFEDDLDVDGTSMQSTGRNDGFLAKYDPAGRLQWARQIRGQELVEILDLAVDPDGQIYVTGRFDETVDFGGTTLQTDTRSMFVARYDAEGHLVWVKVPEASSSIGYSLALDAAGQVYVTGEMSDDFTLGPVTLPWAGSDDVFTLALDRDGNVRWGTSSGGEETDRGYALAVGSEDRCLVAGSFEARADFGQHTLQSAGEDDVFLAKVRGATTPIAIEAPDQRPVAAFYLDQNYPNPFNASTTIAYTIPKPMFVTLTIYNLLGEAVATLVEATQGAGMYRISFEGSQLPSAVYYYRIQAGGFIENRTFVVVR